MSSSFNACCTTRAATRNSKVKQLMHVFHYVANYKKASQNETENRGWGQQTGFPLGKLTRQTPSEATNDVTLHAEKEPITTATKYCCLYNLSGKLFTTGGNYHVRKAPLFVLYGRRTGNSASFTCLSKAGEKFTKKPLLPPSGPTLALDIEKMLATNFIVKIDIRPQIPKQESPRVLPPNTQLQSQVELSKETKQGQRPTTNER